MFDLQTTPFSTRGSYLVFKHPVLRKLADGAGLPDGLYLCTVRGEAKVTDIVRLETVGDGPVTERLTPVSLHLEGGAGRSVDIVFENPAVVRIRCRGMGLRMVRAEWRPFDCIVPHRADHWLLSSYMNMSQFAVRRLEGTLRVDAPWERVRCPSMILTLLPDAGTGVGELSMEEYAGCWSPETATAGKDTWQACHDRQAESWQQWLRQSPAAPVVLASARELAAYINYSCLVNPSGNFGRPAMLMSKYKMTNYWTWDNCFNVLGLATSDPELAWDQLILAFQHQSPQGQLPASFTNATLHWMDAKPPVHGWTLGILMRETNWVSTDHLREVYEPLVAFTEWWFRFRDHDGDGLPAAFHGNDTGWDNASVFDERPPVTTPDLSAYLVIQMEVLGEVAERLDRAEEGRAWKERSAALLRLLIERLWREDLGQFVSCRESAASPAPGDSLINFVPLVVGQRLPQPMRDKLVDALLQPGRFLTDWGFATEALPSPFYNAEGYWRGPIWAPSTLLLWDGLQQSGYAAEARMIRDRFFALCTQAGFAENFHASEGRSLRDPTYTWTSSSFFYLLAQGD
ncbi:MAG: hypothetical protein JJU00_06815 [Opitutales bacterium]|nr:hypothetical protein [Opitutales bacterium]